MCVNVITRSGLFNTVLTVVSLMFSLGVQLVSENLFIKKKNCTLFDQTRWTK